jgi:hypothetical protein
MSEALETLERARGQPLLRSTSSSGEADFALDDVLAKLRAAGAEELAAELERELVGRNVLEDRWTFPGRGGVRRRLLVGLPRLRAPRSANAMTAGNRHVYEAELKARRARVGPHQAEARRAASTCASGGRSSSTTERISSSPSRDEQRPGAAASTRGAVHARSAAASTASAIALSARSGWWRFWRVPRSTCAIRSRPDRAQASISIAISTP